VARRFGTFFIRRGSCRDAARVKNALVLALRGGESVAAFPEGTTSDGFALGRFYPAHASIAETLGFDCPGRTRRARPEDRKRAA
jgi:1-acyl-sn-glycerol-3-phosphate acyltransferase